MIPQPAIRASLKGHSWLSSGCCSHPLRCSKLHHMEQNPNQNLPPSHTTSTAPLAFLPALSFPGYQTADRNVKRILSTPHAAYSKFFPMREKSAKSKDASMAPKVLSQTQNMNTAQISKEKHLAPVFLKRPPLKDPITSRVRSIHKNNPNPAQSPSLTTQHLIPAGILTERKGRNRTRKAWNHVRAGGVLLRSSL